MKPELNVNICQVATKNSEDNLAWVFIDVENTLPDDTGAHPRIKLEIPVRLDGGLDFASSESEAIRKAKNLLSCAISGL
jgi:hypothetical protein